MTEAEVAAATLASCSKPGPGQRAVDLDRREEEALDPARAEVGDRVGRLDVGLVSVQPASDDLAVARVDRDDDPLAVLLQHRVEELRVAQRRGADHDVFGPRPQHVGDAVGVAQPAADLDRERHRVGDPPHVSRFTGSPGLRPVEVDHVEEVDAGVGEAQRRVDRVGVEDRLAVVVALDQPHRVAAADIDRRVEDHAGRGRLRADPGEVGEQPQAGGARLLGVELDAEDVAALGRAGEALAVLGGAERVVGAGAGDEGVDEVEGRLGGDPAR